MTVASTSWVASGPQQLNRKCPPGLSTRATSAYATGRSGKNMTPNWHATMSALASPNGSFIASACRHVAAGTCADPTSTIATLRSVAVTRASGRLVVKARVSTPVPAASSSTSRGRWRTTRAARSSAYGWKTAGTRYSSYASDMSSAQTRLASSATSRIYCQPLASGQDDGLLVEVVVEREWCAVAVEHPLKEVLVHRVLLVEHQRVDVGDLHEQQVLVAASAFGVEGRSESN